jgi:hypothetical protein
VDGGSRRIGGNGFGIGGPGGVCNTGIGGRGKGRVGLGLSLSLGLVLVLDASHLDAVAIEDGVSLDPEVWKDQMFQC